MTNHIHLLASPPETGIGALSEMMQRLGRAYVRYFNDRYGRTGTLWEGRFRSGAIASERHFLVCSRYIELNPVRAQMVTHPADYRWSSFRHNALGVVDDLVHAHPLYSALGSTLGAAADAYAALFSGMDDEEAVARIRHATRGGLSVVEP